MKVVLDPLAAVPFIDRIAICEPRLALSVSAAADVLLESIANPYSLESSPVPNPLADAATIRNQFSLDGHSQTVAIIDSGIAWDHAAFATGSQPGNTLGNGNRVVAGWDFAENDADPYDDGPAGFHGTHVAGILSGLANGFTGMAPGADLVALRVFDDFGRGSLDWIESALRWVIDHRTSLANPITTVNLSLGAFATDTSQPLTQLDDELRQLHDDGVIVVAATGNAFDASRADSLAYPASSPLVAAVTSVDTTGNISGFAQRASGVFAAPGISIRSSVPDHLFGVDGDINDYAAADGTSTATPQFAGATILVRQAMQSLGLNPTPDDILGHLRETSIHRTDPATGAAYDQLDLEAAINTLLAGNHQSTLPVLDSPSPLEWTDTTSLVVHATADTDNIKLDLTGSPTITINSVEYKIDRTLTSLTVDAESGNDLIEIIGSNGADQLTARAAIPGINEVSQTLQAGGLTAHFLNFENVIFHGGGGNDRATFFDSIGNDKLEATATNATLQGVGYTFVAIDVNNVFVHGTAGGSDTAFIYDSSGDDRLAIRHQFTSLRSDSMFRLAYGFERVHAYGGAGGRDTADLYDSPGDDRLAASADFASISSRDYYAAAHGFSTIHAESSAGGHDYATLYAVDTTALWTRSASLLQWTLPTGEARIAQGFETAEAFLGGSKTEVLPQAVRLEFYSQERQATRDLFALDAELF